ncbi:TrkA family potassium uptake protein [Myxosarcina sp. GI1]|uniref:potassium channel family protein n=1 Tax=Myxosarcina sp. GI1 TaxID=1541065 RepID=UPI00056687B3|nr:potassium channel protein [Myxosarcina sp. GI1]
MSSFKRIWIGAIFFAITLIVAIFGYISFGWAAIDSVYMVVITIFGVGYGEVEPLETSGEKIFTMAVILAGTSSAVYTVGGFLQMVTEGEIHRALDEHRRSRGIDRLQNHAIICGFGRMGQILAQQLQQARQEFVIIELNSERVALAEQMGYLTQTGNAADENILQSVGIEKAKMLATVLPDDAVNVFITLTARGLNPQLMILARGELPTTEKKLKLAGADRVVLPAIIGGMRMANLMTRPAVTNYLEHRDERDYLDELLGQIDIKIDELAVAQNSYLVGKTIERLEVRGKGAFIIIALRRHDGTVIKNPDRHLVLEAEDRVIVMGHQADIPHFARANELRGKMRYRGSSLH